MKFTTVEAHLILAIFVSFCCVSFQFTQSQSESKTKMFTRLYASFIAFCLDSVLCYLLLYPAGINIIWTVIWAVIFGLLAVTVLKLLLAQGENSKSIIELIRTFGTVWKEVQDRKNGIDKP